MIRTAAIALATLLATAAPALADGPAASTHAALPSPAALALRLVEADPTATPMPAAAPAAEGRTTVFGLPRNVGTADRLVRTAIGLALAGVGVYGLATDELGGTTSAVLLGVSAVPFATAAAAYCPLYSVLGINTAF